MSIRGRASLTSLCLVAFAGAAAAEAVPRVGVVVALAVNVDPARANELAGALGAALSQELLVETVAGAEAARRMPANGLPDDCVAQPKCIADLGTRLDATQLLLLVMTGAGGGVSIDPTWVDVASGRAVTREGIVIEDSEGDDISARLAATAPRLLPDATLRTPTVVVPPPTRKIGRHFTTGVWVTGAIAAAALIAGTGFGISAMSVNNGLKDDGCADDFCSDAQDRMDSRDSRALIADVSFLVATGAGITAIILYMRSGGEAPIEASASGEGFSVRLHGRF